MARVVDFNINHARHNPQNTNSCSVVINNVKPPHKILSTEASVAVNASGYPEQLVYPGIDSVQPMSVQTRSVTTEGQSFDASTDIEAINRELELYKLLATTFSNILKDNNPKLIANLIDNSGKVIVTADSLVKMIALICNASASDIHIEYIDNEGQGCTCSKINPVKKIEDIKIGYQDFRLGFNDKYNILTTQFNVSLKKCIIPITYGGY